MKKRKYIYFYPKKSTKSTYIYLRISNSINQKRTISTNIIILNNNQWCKTTQRFINRTNRTDPINQYLLYNQVLGNIEALVNYFYDGGFDGQLDNLCLLIKRFTKEPQRLQYIDFYGYIFDHLYYSNYKNETLKIRINELKKIKYLSPEFYLNNLHIKEYWETPLIYSFKIIKKGLFEKNNVVDIYIVIQHKKVKITLKLFKDKSINNWDNNINRFKDNYYLKNEDNLYLSNIQNYLTILPHFCYKNSVKYDFDIIKKNIKKGSSCLLFEIKSMLNS